MAIARGAGTEIIRTTMLETLSTGIEELIFGVAHHIYTVLSIIVQVQALNADQNYVHCFLTGYDCVGGTSAQDIYIFQQDMSVGQTFVWNDKFSFMGNEPVDFTSGLDSAAKQDAIADQGQATAQILKIVGEHGLDDSDVICTFIDQNNA
jgi:hypothetical protein